MINGTLRIDLDLWNAARSVGPLDLLIPPDFQQELETRLAKENITFQVAIADVETAIHGENPNSTDSVDELENRFSNVSPSLR